MKVLLVICAFILCMVSAIEEDYCKINCQGRPHIGCNNDGTFSEKCHPKAKLVKLDGALEARFIDLHNELREKIASGKLPNYKPAAQMGSVTWDEELAKLAALNVKQCQMKHDQCRNTKNYKNAGQNVAMSWHLESISSKKAIREAIELWYDEYSIGNMSLIDEFNPFEAPIREFTQFVDEVNSRIGCALLRTPNDQMSGTEYYITCNYARTNMIGEPVYKSGKPASGCKTGTHPHYPSLCSSAEKYDV